MKSGVLRPNTRSANAEVIHVTFPNAPISVTRPCVCLITLLLLIRPILAKEADYETRSTPHLPFAGVPSCTSVASAELLALLNYESKPNQPVRREGIAIMDIDPESTDFGKILMEVPLPPDLVAHHIFSIATDQACITALNKSAAHAVDLTRFPYRLRPIEVPECQVLRTCGVGRQPHLVPHPYGFEHGHQRVTRSRDAGRPRWCGRNEGVPVSKSGIRTA